MQSSSLASSFADGSDELTRQANTSKEFNEKVDKLSNAHRAIVNLAVWTIRGERDTTIPRSGLGVNAAGLTSDPVLKLRDVKGISTQYTAALKTLKSDLTRLKKRQRCTGTGKRNGQGFSNPKLYGPNLYNFFAAARDEIGQVDINQVNQLRQQDTDDVWNKRGGKGPAPQVPRVELLNPSSNYITDQISFITGIPIDLDDGSTQNVQGMASASILTPLMCIYAAKAQMRALARPPQETANYLKTKYLVAEAEKSQLFKDAKKAVKAANKDATADNKMDEPVVDLNNFQRYLQPAFIQSVMADNTADAPWRNGAYLGATPLMRQRLGDATFQQLTARDNVKLVQNQNTYSALAPGDCRRDKLRNPVEKPVSTADYFPYAALQVLTAINTVPNDQVENVDPVAASALKSPQLKQRLADETAFLSAVLESLNSPSQPGGAQKGRNNTGKRAKKRVDAVLKLGN